MQLARKLGIALLNIVVNFALNVLELLLNIVARLLICVVAFNFFDGWLLQLRNNYIPVLALHILSTHFFR